MTTIIDRRAIMTKAWREYRFQTAWNADKTFDRALFAHCLAQQWAYAKADRAAAVARAVEATRLAAASASERRAAEIAAELDALNFSDFMPKARHGALRAELATLNH